MVNDMSNVVPLHPESSSAAIEHALVELQNAVDSLRLIANFLQRAANRAPDSELHDLTTTFLNSAAEIEQMKVEGSFTQDRLEILAARLQNSWNLFRRILAIHGAT